MLTTFRVFMTKSLNRFIRVVLLFFVTVLASAIFSHFPGVIKVHIGLDGGTLLIDGSPSHTDVSTPYSVMLPDSVKSSH